MLIIEKLKNTEGLTPSEVRIADQILKLGRNIEAYSTRLLADETYTSPAAIIRYCKKIGYSGYDEFRQSYIREINYLDSQFGKIDVNFPFEADETAVKTAQKMAELYKTTIDDTLSTYSFVTMEKVIHLIQRRRNLHIFSVGTNLNIAYAFKEKMEKIGRTVIISNNLRYELYDAACVPSDDAAILISYSGETDTIVEIARILHEHHVPMISLTSQGSNTVASLAQYHLYISTKESMFSNLGDFSTHLSVSFLLDLIYAEYFKLDFDANYERKERLTKRLEKKRKSNNPIIADKD